MFKGSQLFSKVRDKYKQLIDTSKRVLTETKIKQITTAGVSLCAASLITVSAIYASETKLDQLDTVYHVYLDQESIGSVADKQLVEGIISDRMEEVQEDYEHLNLVLAEELHLIPEKVFHANVEPTETVEQLNDKVSLAAEAIVLKADDKDVLYVSDQQQADEVISEFLLQYISEDDLEVYEALVEDSGELEEKKLPDVGETDILAVELSATLGFEEAVAEIDEVLSTEQAVKQLNLGTLEERTYQVEAGDVLGTIASGHQLSTSELLKLNSEVTEDTLLQIGDELNVTEYEPVVTVVVTEAVTQKEEIPYKTEVREDDSMWKGDTKVAQEGKAGERIASYEIVKENGTTIKRSLIGEEVIEEAVDHIVLKGTKESPSRGTGNLSWPAVGGYISSYQGMRWGRLHKGIDIARPTERSILAADNGTVTSAGWNGGYGKTVKIDHNNGMETLYAHLESIDVSVGDTIRAGERIGRMGTTGNSTGIHLHFEVYKNGQLADPMDYLNY
ncbi:peptidoglycan DD-metalloendopeptidase family protein [Desertibacillus haloalkaliphilus]|uniref:peptidoglycan DD-metalloendopeptidase family protein n=1 Tax=Desertibacillus haloalkaliphilus TaxID=1328930 RepID=UPI001C278EEA|nr:M23 family metallopeptidase [Desertibacillus haloalkaliphilus]MBU8905782.1 M23 family metallopeptidase [Desertibacillus haloalkaliphilus]